MQCVYIKAGKGGIDIYIYSYIRYKLNKLLLISRRAASASPQVHTQELKRLRQDLELRFWRHVWQDVEALHNQKEDLRKHLQDGLRLVTIYV